MKILILDDNSYRHMEFAHRFADDDRTHCHTYHQAIEALNNDFFDVIFLDHDLGDFHDADKYEGYDGKLKEYTGLDVAVYIAKDFGKYLNEKPRIVVHSVNPVGAPVMRSVLQDAGFDVVWDPFTEGKPNEQTGM
jgi:hypothetical protein